jgi:annexin A7/11
VRKVPDALLIRVHREFSGHMRDSLFFLVRYYEGSGRGIERDADMLQDAMAGMGTKDERLIWRVVRGHWNRQRWQEVKMVYQTKYNKSLDKAVKGETSGKYEVSRRKGSE